VISDREDLLMMARKSIGELKYIVPLEAAAQLRLDSLRLEFAAKRARKCAHLTAQPRLGCSEIAYEQGTSKRSSGVCWIVAVQN
jgi:hypothetical protein